MQISLQGKIALVTGGSRGIGRAICVRLAEAGAKVFINYSSNAAAAEETLKLCLAAQAKSGNSELPAAELLPFGVDNSEAVEQAFAKIKEIAGGLDILVNNAGISLDGLLLRFKNEDWDRTLAVNLSGAFYCAKAASKLLLRSKAGRIINIGSVVGEMGNAGQVAYVSAKAGLLGMSKALAKELASRSVTVNTITPGFIDTDMTGALDAAVIAELKKSIPLGRTGSADEVATLALYLASDLGAYITGQAIGVNGGIYM